MTLPGDFIQLMHQSYDSATADALCSSLLGSEPEVSVRINPYKIPVDAAPCIPCTPVPWCSGAWYLSERPPFTFDPLLHAGAYYVQEASSMYLHTILQRHAPCDADAAPLRCLDLCAAPGGKSTLLAGILPPGSTLLSNEPIPRRAQILAENMTKWTRMPQGQYPVRCLVTGNYPVDFSRFTSCFDVVVTDVPCSGEGMFRKDADAVTDWSLQKVQDCQQLQRDIVRTIWHSLRPGGLLVYSTCTFNHFEDEDNVRWISQTLGAEVLEQRHFLPGRDRGEGFFIAALRRPLSDEAGQAPEDLPLRGLNILSDSSFVPPEMQAPAVDLTYDEALQYLRREALRIPSPRGPLVLTYHGHVLGPGKGVGSRINNLYPQEWRIRTTYSSTFTLIT